MTADNPTPKQPDTGNIRAAIIAIKHERDYHLVDEPEYVDKLLALFADKLVGLLEEKTALVVHNPKDSGRDQWINAIPVAGVEKLIKELRL